MTEIDTFLSATEWHGADRIALAGDASKRRYERLQSSRGNSAILMIAPPDVCGPLTPFVRIASHLNDAGYSAPVVLASDLSKGFLVLEDLGDDLFARLAGENADTEQLLYQAAVDFLVDLHRNPPPSVLEPLDADTLTEAVGLASLWYGQGGSGIASPTLSKAISKALEQIRDLTEVMILRDFHAENLIWLPDRETHRRVGLLDFQDAQLGHRAYDLVSLLQDARRDVAQGLEQEMIARYVNDTRVDPVAFEYGYATLGAQRSLRILGIFARLALRDGKTRYLDFIPRVWGHVMSCLQHRDLAQLKVTVLDCLPAPKPDHLSRLRAS